MIQSIISGSLPWWFYAFVLCCFLEIYLFIYHSKKAFLEFIIKLGASNFLIFYIFYRFHLQFEAYSNYPERFSFFSWLNWILVMILFGLFLVSYLIRKPARVRAKRWHEIALPLLCAVLPFVILESVAWSFLPWVKAHSLLRDWLQPFYIQRPSDWNVSSIALIMAGNLLIITAMISLKRSFSILTEARDMVATGIYRFLRHPMYVGEILATTGLIFLAPSKLNITLLVVFIIALHFRAGFEEAKIASVHPAYENYRKKVGRYWP